MDEKRGQVSSEAIILIGFFSLVVILLLFTYTDITGVFKRHSIEASASELATQLNRITDAGPDTKYKVNVDLPQSIEKIEYANGELLLTAEAGDIYDEYHYPLKATLVGEVPLAGVVVIEYFEDEYGGYICAYPPEKQQECCIDLVCEMNQRTCMVGDYPDNDCDGFPDYYDVDDDNDGVIDEYDDVSNSSAVGNDGWDREDSDNDGIWDWYDTDDDNDGIPDDMEIVENVSGDWQTADSDNDNIPDSIDQDMDNDGIPDIFDGNVTNPYIGQEDNDGDLIEDWQEYDTDGDGLADWYDKDDDGDGVPDELDSNPHNDEVGNEDYNNNSIPDWQEIDTDGDGMEDWYDPDDDGDGAIDDLDVNPVGNLTGGTETVNIGNTTIEDWIEQDIDGDNLSDWYDLDNDNDGVPDEFDSAPQSPEYGDEDNNQDGTPDWMELDTDGDGLPDWYDDDDDNDFVPDEFDVEPNNPSIGNEDTNNTGSPDWQDYDYDDDGIPDYLDDDDDNDLVPDEFDANPLDETIGNEDSDGNGIPDWQEIDTDNDDIPDVSDPDDDNDGIIDEDDPNPQDPNVPPAGGGPGPGGQRDVYKIYNCTTIGRAGTYELQNNITTTAEICMKIEADGVTLKGNGYTLTGPGVGTTYSVHVQDVENIVIRDLMITEFNIGIIFISVNSSYIYKNHIESCSGIAVLLNHFSYNNKVLENTAMLNEMGLMSSFGYNNTISDNDFSYNYDDGIFLAVSNNSIVENNILSYNDDMGITLAASSGNLIIDNIMTNNDGVNNPNSGIQVQSNCQDNILVNNEMYNNLKDSIFDDSTGLNNYLIYNNTYGEISWTSSAFLQDLTLNASLRFPGTIIIGHGYTYVDAAAFTTGNINSSADVTLRNIDSLNLACPRILREGEICWDCFNLTPMNQDTISFSVPHWSNYSIGGVGLGGSGTIDDPYNISDCCQLQAMNNDLNAYYQLVADVDCSGTSTWNWNGSHYEGFEPVGDDMLTFGGSFDGRNHTISNLYIYRITVGNYVGLFGRTLTNNKNISNIGLVGVNITGNLPVGSLVGYFDSSIGTGTISNSFVTGFVSGNGEVGGLLGALESGTLSNSYSSATVSGNSVIGGLVGYEMGLIINSYSSGNVSGNSDVGGLVGSKYGIITNSYSTGSVSGSSNYGSFIGAQNGELITDSYWYNRTGNPNECYSGGNTNCTAINQSSYFKDDVHPLRQPMASWDFTNTWSEVEHDYPALKWENRGTTILTGSGNETDPFMIYDCIQLQMMEDNLTAYYALANDIDCSDTVNWNDGDGFDPIGNSTTSFKGSLFGNNHTITGLYIDREDTSGVGLIAYLADNYVIENIGLMDVNITGHNYVAGITGRNTGTLRNLFVTGNIDGNSYVGGIVGINSGSLQLDGIIENCYSNVNITGSYSIGGIVGFLNGEMSYCYSKGSVVGTSIGVGGLIGYFDGTLATVGYSFSTSNVSSTGSNKGSLIGFRELNKGTITNCYWNNHSGNLDYCHDYGNGNCQVIQDNEAYFYNMANAPMTSWDFDNIWITDATGYPILQWQNTPSITRCAELQLIRNNLTIDYNLMNDIDCSDTINWNSGQGFERIGMDYDANGTLETTEVFEGTFYGNNYAISNLYINNTGMNRVGLFGYLAGDVQDLGLTDASVSGSQERVGILAGESWGAISQCYSTGEVYGGYAVGGLVGLNGGTITESLSDANAICDEIYGFGSFVGGLVGWNHGGGGEGIINNSYATGNVTAVTGGIVSGGLVGMTQTGAEVINSYSTGYVSASNGEGLIGFESSSTITNSYWDNETSGKTSSDGGTPLSTSQMYNISSYSGWDFTNTWDNIWNLAYYHPLRWQNSKPWPGDGSENYPFEITTCEQLQNMSTNLTAYYALVADVDCSDTSTWNWNSSEGYYQGFIPIDQEIGFRNGYFNGSFDGRSHTISGLYINRPNEFSVGLFGWADANISNVGLLDVNITASGNVGALVGRFGGFYESNYGNITNSFATGYVEGSHSNIGGLIGSAVEETSVRNCYADVNVYSDSTYGWPGIGGLIGTIQLSNISNSYSIGDVTGTEYIGGLVGRVSPNGGRISNCFTVSNVTASGSHYGALVSSNTKGEIINSYWFNNTDSVLSCYDGGNTNCTAINLSSYFQGDVYPNQEPFASWDFFDVWSEQISTYPSLTWQGTGGNYDLIAGMEWINESDAINGTIYYGDNVTINITGTADVDSVWMVIWSGIAGASEIIWEGFLNIVNGIWTAIVDTIGLGEGQYNYTIYANDSFNFTFNMTGSFNITCKDMDGLGTPSRPFNITNCCQLQNMEDNLTAYYQLTQDIDCSGTSHWGYYDPHCEQYTNWTSCWDATHCNWDWSDPQECYTTAPYGFVPIGNGDDRFTGNFEGNNHTIVNLTINYPGYNYVGLFGFADNATISNVILLNPTVVGGGYVGGLIGWKYSSGFSENIHVVNGSTTCGGNNGGGLIGNNNGLLRNSSATGYVRSNNYAGGLVGFNTMNTGIIVDSFSMSNVSASSSGGGLVGNGAGYINRCYSISTVTGGNNIGCLGGSGTNRFNDSYGICNLSGNINVGGLIGKNTGHINNSFFVGDIQGNTQVGGLVGHNDVGSIVGIVSNSFSVATINASSDIGGLVGWNDGATILDSYYNNNSESADAFIGTGSATCVGCTAIQDDESYFQSNVYPDYEPMASWDFFDTWSERLGGYPVLTWQGTGMNVIWDGSGTEADPFQVTDCIELQNVTTNLTASYALMNDIDCSDTVNWNGGKGFNPFGKNTYPGDNCSVEFCGTFFGRNKTVSNLYINRALGDPETNGEALGLFGVINRNGSVMDLGVDDVNITGTIGIGGIAGLNYGSISRSYSTGRLDVDWGDAGGLVGWNYGNISDCYSIIYITGADNLGGITSYHTGGEIRNCYAAGYINGSGFINLGGISSAIEDGAKIINSFSTISLNDMFTQTGGIVGTDYGNGTLMQDVFWYNHSDDDVDSCYYLNANINCSVVNDYGVEVQRNGGFDYDDYWVSSGNTGGAWMISLGTAKMIQGSFEGSDPYIFTNDMGINITPGHTYNVTYDFSGFTDMFSSPCCTVSSLYVSLGGVEGTSHGTAGIYTELITAVNDSPVKLMLSIDNPSLFLAEVDNLTVVDIDMGGIDYFKGNVYPGKGPMSSWDFFDTWLETPDDYPVLAWQGGGSYGEGCGGGMFGSGTEADPCMVTNCVQLQAMRSNVSAYYKLMNDIDCSDTINWNVNPECAAYDQSSCEAMNDDCRWHAFGSCDVPGESCGHSEWNCNTYCDGDWSTNPSCTDQYGFIPIGDYSWETYEGEFFNGTLDGNGKIISDLFIYRPYIRNFTGLFGLIDNGFVFDVGIENANITGNRSVGIMAGYLWAAGTTNIYDSYVTGNVEGEDYVGGLLGVCGTVINNTYANANVTANDYDGGGLVGAMSWVYGKIYNSYAIGSVYAYDEAVGGLVGEIWYGAEIFNSFVDINITGGTNAWSGAISGGWSGDINVTNSYFNNHTDAWEDAKCIGNLDYVILDCYSIDNNSDYFKGDIYSGSNPFAAWDFYDTWHEVEDDYPHLAWEGIGGSYKQGDGTEESPFNISTCSDLQEMNQDLTAHYQLIQDINCSDTINWNSGAGFNPIGCYSLLPGCGDRTSTFQGTFDGMNYTISGLYIYRPTEDYVGLFGRINSSAVVKNVGVIDANVTGDTGVGILVARADFSSINGSFTSGVVSGGLAAGGLIGNTWYANISDSYSGANVSSNDVAGGFIGDNTYGYISDCYATGNVTDPDANGFSLGGFVGNNNGVINDSFSTGGVWQTGMFLGGFAGSSTDTLDNVYFNNITANPSDCVGSDSGTTSCTAIQDNEAYFFNVSKEPLTTWSYPPWSSFCTTFGYPVLEWNEPAKRRYCPGYSSNDTSAPAVTIISPTATTYDTCMLHINISLNESGDHCNFSIDNWATNFTMTTDNLTYFYNLTFNNMTSTGQTLRVVCEDIAGNINSAEQVSFTLGYTTVSRCDQLQCAAYDLNEDYTLTNDINCSNTTTWNWNGSEYLGFYPIGAGYSGGFSGDLIGNDYIITNLYINRPHQSDVGLFGSTAFAADIDDVGLEDVNITGANGVSGLVGYYNRGRIRNSYTTGTIVGRGYYVAGLVGFNYGYITECYSTADVSGGDYTAGLVGWQDETLNRSYATGDVTGDTPVGGLVARGGSNEYTMNSYATGNVNGSGDVGGFMGIHWYHYIEDCYSTGNVTGDTNVGGFLGFFDGAWSAPSKYYIHDSFSTGSVTGNTNVGSFIGRLSNGTLERVYFNNHSGNPDGCVGFNEQLNQTDCTAIQDDEYYFRGDVYPGAYPITAWDFISVWEERTAMDDYPVLYWQNAGDVIRDVITANEQGKIDGQVMIGDDVTINATTSSDADSVWAVIWDGIAGVSTAIWQGFLSLVNGVWTAVVGTNDTFPVGYVNFTVYANNSEGYIMNVTGSFRTCPLMDGSGTALDPYNITMCCQLQAMELDLTAYYQLVQDIDCSETINWHKPSFNGTCAAVPIEQCHMTPGCGGKNATWDGSQTNYRCRERQGFDPIGNYEYCIHQYCPSSTWYCGYEDDCGNAGGTWVPHSEFTGTFDGMNHTISNLFINREMYRGVGLFGKTGQSAVIKNVGLLGANVSGSSYTGPLVGYNRGDINNTFSTGVVYGYCSSAGGLIGYSYGSSSNRVIVNNSYSEADVVINSVSCNSQSSAGGFMGRPNRYTDILNSYATGDVDGGTYSGGFSALLSSYSTVTNSFSTGKVYGPGAAGMFGIISDLLSISNSYWLDHPDDDAESCYWIGTGNGNAKGNENCIKKTNVTYFQGDVYPNYDPMYYWDFNDQWEERTDDYPSFQWQGLGTVLDYDSPLIADGHVINHWGFMNETVETGTNVTFSMTSIFGVNGAWVTVWQSTPGSAKVWEGNMSNSTPRDWGVMITTNATFPEYKVNFTVYATNGSNQTNRSMMYLSCPAKSGSGSAGDPYQISLCCQLEGITYERGAYYELVSDIDCSMTNPDKSNWDDAWIWRDGKGFDPIGDCGIDSCGRSDSSNPFYGQFDGNGYTIGNLFINNTYKALGLFARLNTSARVGNFTMENVSMTGNYQYLGVKVGGVVGYNYGKIHNVGVIGNLTSVDTVGGIAAYMFAPSATLDNCYTKGIIIGDDNIGGIVGSNSDGRINNCYSEANVIGGTQVGGLVGYHHNTWMGADGYINNSYAIGNITGSSDVGGLVGWNRIGINNSFATGRINMTSSYLKGGLVGDQDGTLTNCYWYNHTDDSATACGESGSTDGCYNMSLDNFKGDVYSTNAPFGNWSFFDIWEERLDDYPSLSWQSLGGGLGADVTYCRELNQPNTYYTLYADITNYAGTCFNITADNVTLDLNSFTVDGDIFEFGESGVYIDGYDNITIKNGKIQEFNYDGITFIGSSNNFITNVTIDANAGSAITFWGSSNNNLISDSSISNHPGFGLYIDSSYNAFVNLNMLSNGNDIYLSVFYPGNILIYNNSYGEIGFELNETITDDLVFPGDINITNNSVYVDSNDITKLNKSANITLYSPDLSGITTPVILKDGNEICNSTTMPSCYNFTQLTADTVQFNVSSWSNYSIGEKP